MFCTKCGKEVVGAGKFCANCGEPTDPERRNETPPGAELPKQVRAGIEGDSIPGSPAVPVQSRSQKRDVLSLKNGLIILGVGVALALVGGTSGILIFAVLGLPLVFIGMITVALHLLS